MRILLVEDDEMLAQAVERALRQSAHSVQRAATGKEADSILDATEFDLLLLDLGLPQMDGFEVLRRLRARRSHVPVMVLTVRDSVEVFVYRLRRKIDGSGVDIRTVRGMGYLIERPSAS